MFQPILFLAQIFRKLYPVPKKLVATLDEVDAFNDSQFKTTQIQNDEFQSQQ